MGMMKKMTFLMCTMLAVPLLAADDKIATRLNESTAVLTTIVSKQDIPKSTLDSAVCVIVYPGVKKVGVGIGVSYGRGVLSCRTGKTMEGKWSSPSMYKLDTGSLGAQLGSTSTDYVILVMTQRGADKILSGKLKMGQDASAVAGPSGAKAVGTKDPNVDLLTYSQAKGLFAGASLGGASMEADDDANKDLYGKEVDVMQIVREGMVTPPAAAHGFMAELEKASPKYMK
jgi:lipid-binding SYLF domain-containing protein